MQVIYPQETHQTSLSRKEFSTGTTQALKKVSPLFVFVINAVTSVNDFLKEKWFLSTNSQDDTIFGRTPYHLD